MALSIVSGLNTSDGLVCYRKDLRPPPLLYEVKYRADLKGQIRI